MAFDLISQLKKEQNRLQNKNDDFLANFVKMPEGEGNIVVRILPAAPDKDWFFTVTRTHRLGNKTFHSPKVLNRHNNKWEGVCPLETHYRWLWKQSERTDISAAEREAFQNEARSIKPVERYYLNVIVRSYTDPKTGVTEKNVGPKVLSIGKELHQKIIRKILGDEISGVEGLGDVTDLATGRDFRIVKRLKKGAGAGGMSYPSYDDSDFMGVSVAGNNAETDKWMNTLHDLEGLIKIKPMEELAKELRIFRGLEKEEDTTNVANETHVAPTVVKANTAPVSKAKSAVVEDDDESLADNEFLQNLKNM